MNKILLIACLLFAGCSNPVRQEAIENDKNNSEKDSVAVQLNSGAKWKVDEATRRNVTLLRQVVYDSAYSNSKNPLLVPALQSRIDTLLQQCTMQGPAHEALHQWLQKVLHGVKELKEDEVNEYEKAFAALKKDIDLFNSYFE